MEHLVLTGLSGSGKTTLGRRVARALDLPFVDLDEVIEGMAGLSIPDIFAAHGEGHFRALETQAVREAVQGPSSVIATGGGTVLEAENVALLRGNGVVVFLDRAVENIEADIDFATRPLLAEGESVALYRMAAERRPAYLAAADFVLPNTGAPEEVTEKLVALARGPAPRREAPRPTRAALRREVDEIDEELLALFVRRMEAAAAMVAAEEDDGPPLTDAAREQDVMNRALAQVPAHLREETGLLVRTLLDLARRVQAGLLEQRRAEAPKEAAPAAGREKREEAPPRD